jgi:hypothetical protein
LLILSFLRGSFPPRPAAHQCRCTWGFGSVRTGPCLPDARSQLSVAHLAARSTQPPLSTRRVSLCLTITTTIFSIVNHGLALFENHGNLHLRLNPKVTCLPLPESPSLPDSIGSRLQQGNISESRPDCQSSADCGELPSFVIASLLPSAVDKSRLSNQSLPGTGSSSFLVLSGRPSPCICHSSPGQPIVVISRPHSQSLLHYCHEASKATCRPDTASNRDRPLFEWSASLRQARN